MHQTESRSPQLNRIQMLALIVGVVGAVIAVIGAFINPQQFFYSYLFGYVYWVSLALGCFAIMMIHHLVGGDLGLCNPPLSGSGGDDLAVAGGAVYSDYLGYPAALFMDPT